LLVNKYLIEAILHSLSTFLFKKVSKSPINLMFRDIIDYEFSVVGRG